MSSAVPEQLSNAEQRDLNDLTGLILDEQPFPELLPRIERALLGFFQAERFRLYRRFHDSLQGLGHNGAPQPTLELDLKSLPGCAVLNEMAFAVAEVYDPNELRTIDPKLVFEYPLDQESGLVSQTSVVAPIKSEHATVGALQLLDRRGAQPFGRHEAHLLERVAASFAERFPRAIRPQPGPYDELVQTGRLPVEALEAFEAEADRQELPISVLLQTQARLTPAQIGAALEAYYMVPWMGYDDELEPDATIADQLNREFLKANCWAPFVTAEGEVVILIDDPDDSDRVMEIQHLISAPSYELRVGLKEDILRYLGIELITPEIEEMQTVAPALDLSSFASEMDQKREDIQLDDVDDDSELTSDSESDIIQLVNRLIVQAVEEGASDIHINPARGSNPTTVRMRLDGICRQTVDIPASLHRAVIARIKVLSRLDIAERRKPQDGKISVTMKGSPLELRVATFPTVNGEAAVLRILAAGDPLPFAKLNFAPRTQQVILRALEHPHGIVLVVGPTGSGKTTSLHGLLGYLNTPERNILTAEDPVEITQPGLQQVQVQPKIGLTFASALRSFLRADPDVILIGEMRDQETAHAGMEASLTGHLVFSTLHTNSAPETVIRLLDMGLDPLNFADALVAVVAQRLVRTLCGKCKEAYSPEPEEWERLKHFYGEEYWAELEIDEAEHQLCRPVGCKTCLQSGYKGRTGVHEVLEATKPMKKLISEQSTVSAIRELALREGMRTLIQDGVYKILQGQIDLEQLRKVAVD